MMEFHSLRRVLSLDGLWDFEFFGDVDPESFDPEFAVFCERMVVPGAFDGMPAYAGKRGLAAYRRRLEIPADHSARIHFGAVSIWCRVWIDGKAVRDHGCGYAPFHVDLPPSESARRELVVLVDNRFDARRAPMHEAYSDFYQYGGIIREVVLHHFPEGQVFIDRVEITPSDTGYRLGEIEVVVGLEGWPGGEVEMGFQIDGGEVEERRVWPGADGTTRVPLIVPGPQLWSPQTPHLHRLRVVVRQGGAEVDDMAACFGLRTVRAHDGGIFLNNEPIRLRGYNRHEWHPAGGPATSLAQMLADVQMLLDLGCNFVRGAHYPQDQRFLDLCDRHGLLVWEENLGWQQREAAFSNPLYREHHGEALEAMIRASYNHPSVIMWGFLNEADSDKEYSDGLFRESAEFVRRRDGSRLLSYASDRPMTDRHFDLVDVISINTYPGWYKCGGIEEPLRLVRPALRELFAALDERGWSEKPILISEIGAEALYGHRDPNRDFFSEEYQAELLGLAIQEAVENPRCAGIALWQFSDTRSHGGGRALARPRTFNNKGTLDEYRRPKIAYERVRSLFRRGAEWESICGGVKEGPGIKEMQAGQGVRVAR